MKFINRSILFYSGLFLALLSGLVELWLFVIIVQTGKIDLIKALVIVVNGGFVFGTTKMIIEAWRLEFLSKDIINIRDLNQCHSNRLQAVKSSESKTLQIIPDVNRKLITQYLALLEGILQKNLGSYHYELSVFCGTEYPDIIAYYDTNMNTVPRSRKNRNKNTNYYVEKRYEVVELLRNPSTITQYIDNTHADSENYSFTSEDQKNKIRSTILHCVDITWPAAIVITCNKEKILGKNDEFKEAFLSIYAGIATDLNLSSLIKNVREQ